MKILFVTDNRFWRCELGSHRRIASMVERFLGQGHVVEVVFTGRLYPPDMAALRAQPPRFVLHTQGERSHSGSVGTATGNWLKGVKRLKLLLRQLVYQVVRFFQPQPVGCGGVKRKFALQLREPKLCDFESESTLMQFRDVCKSFTPDVVIIEYVRLAWLLQRGRDVLPEGSLSLIDTHDVQYERQSRFHARDEVHDIDITPAEEGRALSEGDVVIAIQAADARKLELLVPGKRVIVVGFPCSLQRHPVRLNGPMRIGFFGSSMLPNQQAVKSLIERIFPALEKPRADQVELHVYGSVCSMFSQDAVPDGIFLHGFVDDLDAAYAAIDIIANPVAFGGGLKIKNVEALSHGRALVTTPIGAEGMEDGAQSAFLLARDESDFIRLLDSLIRDSDSRLALGGSAFEYARTHFSEDVVYRELDDLLADYLASRTAERRLA